MEPLACAAASILDRENRIDHVGLELLHVHKKPALPLRPEQPRHLQGLKLEEIGRRLHLSGKTVATHKYRLLDKLAIRDTVSLARLATQYGVHDATMAPH